MDQDLSYIYKYRFGLSQFYNLLIGIGLLIFGLFLPFKFELDNTLMVIISIFSFIGLVTLLLTAIYLIKSYGLQIHIDQSNGIFQVTNRGKTNSYQLENITSVEICQQKSIGLYGFAFDFAKYTFGNGEFCIVTNFMTDEYFIPAGVEPRVYKSILPIIWKRTNIYK